MQVDVAIVGGGPAGTTVGALLKRYAPEMSVAIVERERFPRDHVGESQLPAISGILHEMRAWDAVEASGFPIKIGGTYRWGRTDELWDFEFIPGAQFEDAPRPGRYEGQRKETAFQVDRSIYDKVLLDHARELGCKVREETPVRRVRTDGERVSGIDLESGEELRARWYVDASGEAGILRRALGIGVTAPTALRNVAFWDYWQNADWAVTLGNGGTRIQVLSLGWGWIWFIPITPTRTSIGLVVPADFYKASGKTKDALYAEAIAAEPLVAELTKDARREGPVQGTKDWNFLADRLAGENWFLAGDAGGFADPILSAGMTLAHTSGRKIAYTILELARGEIDADWLKNQYSDGHRSQIRHHMQFADYWYSANGRFTDLQGYCSEIARTAGLELDAGAAFRWLATGGFALEEPGLARALSYRVGGIKLITQHFGFGAAEWDVAKANLFRLNLQGAQKELHAVYLEGRIEPTECFRRGDRLLPLVFVYWLVYNGLTRESDAHRLMTMWMEVARANRMFSSAGEAYNAIVETLESMIAEGWVEVGVDPCRPFLKMETPEESGAMHRNRDNVVRV